MELEKSSRQISKNTEISNFIKIRPVGAQLFHADRRTDMTKLIVAFRNFAYLPKDAIKNRNDVAGPETRLRAGRPGVRIPVRGKRFFCSPKRPHRLCGPHSLLSSGHRNSFPVLKWSRREAYQSHPSNAKVKNESTFTSTSLYAFMAEKGKTLTFITKLMFFVAQCEENGRKTTSNWRSVPYEQQFQIHTTYYSTGSGSLHRSAKHIGSLEHIMNALHGAYPVWELV